MRTVSIIVRDSPRFVSILYVVVGMVNNSLIKLYVYPLVLILNL